MQTISLRYTQQPRAGKLTLPGLIALALVAMIAGSAGYYTVFMRSSAQGEIPLTIVAERKAFMHELKIQGTVDSMQNAEVECEVDFHDSWWPTIIEVVEEGTYVQEGDLLMRIETSKIDELILEEEGRLAERQSWVIQAKANLEVAQMNLKEYMEGDYKLQLQNKKLVIDQAEEKLRNAQSDLVATERLYRKGYVTKTQVAALKVAAQSATNQLDAATIDINVLQSISREKKIKELESRVAAAEAALQSKQRWLLFSEERLNDLYEDLKQCELRAPCSGYVVLCHLHHNGHSHWIRIGEKIRPGQTVIKLPNPRQMQLNVLLAEDVVSLVEPGQSVTMTFDALQGVKLTGEVLSVNEYAEPEDRHQSSEKKFATVISIDPQSVAKSGAALRPGLTADASIRIDQSPNELQVPMQAIIEHDGEDYCLTYDDDGKIEPHKIDVAKNNGKYAVIREGLEPGNNVIIASQKYSELAFNNLETMIEIAAANEAAERERRIAESRHDSSTTQLARDER